MSIILEPKITKQEIYNFSRILVLLFNRIAMYQSSHPQIKQTIDDFYSLVGKLLESVSPLVFIHNREQFFVDEEPIDPRINVQKIVKHFKKTGIQSISFEKGLDKHEIRAFLEIYSSLDKYPDADAMKKRLKTRGVNHLKINHVVFIKATEDDELVSRGALKSMSPEMTEEAQLKSKKLFMDMIVESVVSEEFEKALTIENLMTNPAGLSSNMIETDLAGFHKSDAKDSRPGQVLLHQLDIMKQEVDKKLLEEGEVDLSKMATAVFDMENKLKEEIEAQKAQGVAYPDETLILDKANEIKENVLIQVARDESKRGEISFSQVEQIMRRSGADDDDRLRLLPKIKAALAEKNLTIENLKKNPAGFSKNMIEADLAGFRKSDSKDNRPGRVLLHQLDIMKQEVDKNLYGDDDVDLSEVASVVFGMKRQLIADMESQKALKIAYSNEERILDKVNEITDNVLLQLLKDEYKTGKISTSRLAQILRRLVPEADELKRLLPQIKITLLKEGMAFSEYIQLIQELGKELESEELAKILQKSAEEIGLDGEGLIQEVKKDPVQAATLISLAAEIRKGTGDEKVLSDLLVDYVEQLGSEATLDFSKEDAAKGEQHLRQVITDIETGIVGRLRNMDIKENVINRLEERLNDRVDEVFEKVKMDIIHSRSDISEKDSRAGLSVLEILEQNVGDSEELGDILEIVRAKVRSEDIDENNFIEIYAEITEEQKRRNQEEEQQMSAGVLKAQTIEFLVQKEISRAKRYGVPFVVLAFSLVSAKPITETASGSIPRQDLMNAILKKLSKIVRDSDIVGEFGKNKIGVLLSHTPPGGGERALRRCLKLLYSKPIKVNGTPFDIKLAGVNSEFDVAHVPNAKAFIDALFNDLLNMEIRIKNIHSLA